MFLTPIYIIATIFLLIWINANLHHQFQLTAGQRSTTAACKNLNGWSHSGQCCDFKHTAYPSSWLRNVEVDIQNTFVRRGEEILDQSPLWKSLCLQLFLKIPLTIQWIFPLKQFTINKCPTLQTYSFNLFPTSHVLRKNCYQGLKLPLLVQIALWHKD